MTIYIDYVTVESFEFFIQRINTHNFIYMTINLKVVVVNNNT